MIFVVTGPSGCGKSTLIREVRGRLKGLGFSVSHTTRPPRPTEKDGVDYHFVSGKVFGRMRREGRFVEWAAVHGHLYGTARKELERRDLRDIVLDIDVQGARQVRQAVPGAVLVFVMPPQFDELRRRLEGRNENAPDDVARRLAAASGEVKAYAEFDYVVVNHDLGEASAELEAVIVAARCRTAVRSASLAPILKSFREAGRRPASKKAGRS
jgi:guanylate kinase